MGKDVIEHGVLIDPRPPPPLDGLIEHHEEEPVLRATEERFQQLGSIELAWFRQGCRHRVSCLVNVGRVHHSSKPAATSPTEQPPARSWPPSEPHTGRC